MIYKWLLKCSDFFLRCLFVSLSSFPLKLTLPAKAPRRYHAFSMRRLNSIVSYSARRVSFCPCCCWNRFGHDCSWTRSFSGRVAGHLSAAEITCNCFFTMHLLRVPGLKQNSYRNRRSFYNLHVCKGILCLVKFPFSKASLLVSIILLSDAMCLFKLDLLSVKKVTNAFATWNFTKWTTVVKFSIHDPRTPKVFLHHFLPVYFCFQCWL